MGVGINTGTLTLGTIGGPMRLKCGVIGDAVNLASRIESLSKVYGSALLISDHTRDRLSDPGRFCLRQVDRVMVKGKTQPVTLFEVLDAETPEVADPRRAVLEDYGAAVEAFYARRFAAAAEGFSRCLAAAPGDLAAQGYLQRARQHQASGVPPDWTGTLALDRK
jgi:hypothetical protein